MPVVADVDVLRRATLAEGVPSALAGTRDAIDAVLRDRGLRSTSAEQTGESLLAGAAASAVLAGSSTGLDGLRAGDADLVATAAARLNSQLLGLLPILERAPAQALARMHVLAARGLVGEEAALGRPVGQAAAQSLRRVSALLLADPDGLPALAVAAVAHAEVAATEPFGPGSGLVARALERAVVVGRGVDPAGVLVPEAGHCGLAAEYAAALAAYSAGTPAGLHTWLLYSSRAWLEALRHGPLAP
jgi:hypothetical protein